MVPTLSRQQETVDQNQALQALLVWLKTQDYRFITPTPATHGRVIARNERPLARSLRDVFGWNLPFEPILLPPPLLDSLAREEVITQSGDLLRSAVRVSSLGEDLYLHSSYPTTDADAVFFGPDSYRFADLIETELAGHASCPSMHVVDIGTGSGVGIVVAARRCNPVRLTVTDINPRALALAGINLGAAGYRATSILSPNLDDVTDPIDLALANPPFIIDESERQYRNGGGANGSDISVTMAKLALDRLAPKGRLILYTGSAIVEGEDDLRGKLENLADEAGCSLRYREIDPDIFGEELERPAYCHVERIAAVAAVFER
ncbi:methyltransferase [Novosphingobium sp. FGD1]|uniref:Methyltransferase n=1 Tax=Novosphingobium silvae TaxID=2692619 RepID=A0A7X4GFE0_9SPHN|nr:methyltransferase [Novosphingobium silvae]MYL97246.1 methyltransferase [Novosphingobium silvae]